MIVPITGWLLDYPVVYIPAVSGENCLSSIPLTLVRVFESSGEELFAFSFPSSLENACRPYVQGIRKGFLRADETVVEESIIMHSKVLLYSYSYSFLSDS